MRRSALVVGIALVAVLLPVPAMADELGDYLERASEAEFSGEELVVCSTPDGAIFSSLEVAQAGGVVIVTAPVEGGGSVVAGEGQLATEAADGTVEVTRVGDAGDWQLADRYSVEELGDGRYLNRRVDMVEVGEGGRVRVSLFFDRGTGAMLRSEVFNGDGSTYCETRFVSFDGRRPEAPVVAVAPPAETVELLLAPEQIDPQVLPAGAAGFERVDVYQGTDEGFVGYYADGVFSFSVFYSLRPVVIAELEDSPRVRFNGGEYQRAFGPGYVVYSWETPAGGYALIGDLPLDMQEDVLAELPQPAKPGLFERLWRRFFW